MDEWAVIPEFSRYEVSTTGLVRVRKTGKLKLTIDTGRVLAVSLIRDDGWRTTKTVGSLMLLTFVGPRQDSHECSHRNGDYHDNRLENLKWETHAENEARKREHGTYDDRARGSRQGSAKLTEADVAEIKSSLAQGVRGRELARRYAVGDAVITRIKQGKSWRHVEG